jgi:hypothetical protein
LSAFPVKGHLDRLITGGHVRMDRQSSPPRWEIA